MFREVPPGQGFTRPEFNEKENNSDNKKSTGEFNSCVEVAGKNNKTLDQAFTCRFHKRKMIWRNLKLHA